MAPGRSGSGDLRVGHLRVTTPPGRPRSTKRLTFGLSHLDSPPQDSPLGILIPSVRAIRPVLGLQANLLMHLPPG